MTDERSYYESYPPSLWGGGGAGSNPSTTAPVAEFTMTVDPTYGQAQGDPYVAIVYDSAVDAGLLDGKDHHITLVMGAGHAVADIDNVTVHPYAIIYAPSDGFAGNVVDGSNIDISTGAIKSYVTDAKVLTVALTMPTGSERLIIKGVSP